MYPENQQITSTERNPIIGTFHTGEVRPWDIPQQNTEKVITFQNPYSTPPCLLLGFNEFNTGSSPKVQVSACTIQKDRFTAHIDGGDLYSCGCTWLEVAANDPDFQFGTFNVLEDHHPTNPKDRTARLITFPRAYSAPPKVVVWLTAFSMHAKKSLCVTAYAANITATSFTINLGSWSDTVLYSATATWVAYAADKANIFSGRFKTEDVRPWNDPQLNNSKYVEFGKNIFSAPPRIFSTIDTISIDCKHNLRLRVYSSSVSAAGMTWHLDSWDDTVLYSAWASYIALG